MAGPVAVFANRYELEREIARGGMAEVYLARDGLLDRAVAVKVLSAENARDPSFVERFRREAQSAANLNHPDIVAIYDWGQEQGTYFIVMEYVAGHTLRDVLRLEGQLSPERAATIASEIAAALEYAHQSGVVHRDVKPGNVLVNSDGVAKVTDFGIARAEAGDALTQTGSVMGTATYFSPEQAQGFAVDGRSDVYSLGVVLYEMVCGVPPFKGDSPVSVAYQHVREEPPRPITHRADVPPDLETIIMACLAKDPDERYQSAADLREDLLRFLRGRPPIAAPVTGAVAAVAGDPTVAGSAVDAADTTVLDTTSPKKRRRWWVFLLVLLLLAGGVALIWYLSSLGGTAAAQVEVPDVVGQDLEEATQQLENLGFDVEVREEPNELIPEGLVGAQDPEAGTEVREGSEVTLLVSAGAPDVTIPNVAGRPVAEARALLEERNFTVLEREEESDSVDAGLVIRSEPAAGQSVPARSEVTLIVSRGAGDVEVPNVAGRNVNEAVTILSQAGLVVEQVREPSLEVPVDTVIRTDPPAGTLLQEGSTVRLVVSSGAPTGQVPGVVGRTQAEAEAAIGAAGFTARVVVVESSPANDGRVVDQNPTGGQSAPAGSEIVIQVGQATTTTAPPTTTTTVP